MAHSDVAPSMAMIARRAGVAKSTVSMALRNDPAISERQRIRIQKIATKMGYRTNALVARLMQELRASRKRRYVATLAFVDASINNPKHVKTPSLITDLRAGAEARAAQLGYGVDYFWLHDPGITPERLAKIFRTRNIHGVAIYSIDKEVESLLPKYEPVWSQFPVLTIGSRNQLLPFHFVCNDQYSTAFQGCARLLSLGYRRVGLYQLRWHDAALEHRFVAGYQTCINQAGLEAIPVFYLDQPRYNIQKTYSGGKNAFACWVSDNRLDAVLAINSWIFEWMSDLKLRMPEDLGVALLDLPKELRGKVAGMEQRAEWVGMSVVDALIGQILRHESELPAFQRGTIIESTWVDGATVRSQPSR
jgi:Transcriptional regulators